MPAGAPPVNQWALVGQKRGSLDMVGGQYEDVYAKTPLGWRFQSRKLVPVQVRRRPDAHRHVEDDAREAGSDRHGSGRGRSA